MSKGSRIVITGLLILALTGAGCQERPKQPEKLSPLSGSRMLLVGIDGASWRALRPMVARGELPNFSRVAEEGTQGDLLSLDTMISPVVWTSIATGKLPEKHGIYGFAVEDRGTLVPVSSNMRRTKALWNILSEAGRTVNVVGWYVTWPAEAVNGMLVSDHLVPRDGSSEFWPVAAEEEARLRGRTFPGTLMRELVPLIPRREEFLFTFDAVDTARARIAVHLMKTHPAQFTAVYFWGLDPIQHMSWRSFEEASSRKDAVSPGELREGGNAIPDYLKRLDGFLGNIVDAIGDEATVIIVSDHGFGAAEPPRDFHGTKLTGDHRPEGILMLKGPNLRRGGRLPPASVLDVTPTVLYILGLPLGRDMDGRVIREAFEPSFLETHPIQYVDSYDGKTPPGSPEPIPSPLDPGLIQSLRDLGYLH